MGSVNKSICLAFLFKRSVRHDEEEEEVKSFFLIILIADVGRTLKYLYICMETNNALTCLSQYYQF